MMETAFNIWLTAIKTSYKLLLNSPSEWNSGIWKLIEGISGAMTAVASALLVLFFFVGLTQKGINLKELRQPEVAFSLFLRLGISAGVVSMTMPLMTGIFTIIQGILKVITKAANPKFNGTIPKEITDAIDDSGILAGIGIQLIGIILVLVTVGISIVLLVLVWGRFFILYMHFAIGGIFLSGFAAETTQFLGVSFLKSFAGAVFQGVVIALALLIYSFLISTGSNSAIEAANAGDNMKAILLYSKDFLVGAFVLIAICKGADRFAEKVGL